jgi:hypothetical protein
MRHKVAGGRSLDPSPSGQSKMTRLQNVVLWLERAATFGYFIPTMVRLQRGTGLPDAQTLATLSQWMWLNHARHVLLLVGWLIALRALTLRRGL